MDVDRYPSLGCKRRISGPEEALAVVRARWPGATQEGSTGAERTWTIGRGPNRLLVAHHWNPRFGATWWLRMADSDEDAIRDD